MRPLIFSLLCLCSLPVTAATFVLFDNDGTFSTPAFVEDNVTVTGSADVHLFQSNGLGIVGGASDTLVDSFEYVDFTFTTPVINATYRLDTFACTSNGGSCVGGLRWIEAFTPGGVSLGSIQTSGFDYTVSSLFGNVPIGDVPGHSNGQFMVCPDLSNKMHNAELAFTTYNRILSFLV